MSKIKTIKVGGVVYDIKAQYDGSGNNIETTYATKTEVDTNKDKFNEVLSTVPDLIFAGEIGGNIFHNAILFLIPTYSKNADNSYNNYPDGHQEIAIEAATDLNAGLMSANDKTKLDSIKDWVKDVRVHTSSIDGTINLFLDMGSSEGSTTSFPIATKTTAGAMSAKDKAKLDTLESSVFVNLSLAEYDALPDSKLTDGKYYCII